MTVLMCRDLRTKREALLREVLKDSELKQIIRTEHPFITVELIDATEHTLEYRLAYRHKALPYRTYNTTFMPGYFSFSMGQNEALELFKTNFNRALRAFLVNETHEESEHEIETLKIIENGVIDWLKFESLIDLITCKLVEGGLLFVGVKQDEDSYTIGFKPVHHNVIMQPLMIKYDKTLIHEDMAFISTQFSDEMANTSLKETFIMDLVRELYKRPMMA